MKKIVTFLVFCLVTLGSYGQNGSGGFGFSESTVTQESQQTPPPQVGQNTSNLNLLPRVEILGRGQKPYEVARIFEVYGTISHHNVYIEPDVTPNGGYGENGTFSHIYIDGEYFGRVQFLDVTEQKLLPILQQDATAGALEAIAEACPTQLVEIRRAYEEAVRRYQNNLLQNQAPYSENRNRTNNNESVDIIPRGAPAQTEERPFMYQNYDGRGNVNANRDFGVIRTNNASSNTVIVRECNITDVQQQYPALTAQYIATGDLDAFDPIKYQVGKKEYWRVLHCATGKTWFGRNAWWVVPVGVGILTTGGLAIANNLDSGGNSGQQPVDSNDPRVPNRNPDGSPNGKVYNPNVVTNTMATAGFGFSYSFN